MPWTSLCTKTICISAPLELLDNHSTQRSQTSCKKNILFLDHLYSCVRVYENLYNETSSYLYGNQTIDEYNVCFDPRMCGGCSEGMLACAPSRDAAQAPDAAAGALPRRRLGRPPAPAAAARERERKSARDVYVNIHMYINIYIYIYICICIQVYICQYVCRHIQQPST